MKKIEMALFITRTLFNNDNVDKDNWKVKDLMKHKKDVLSDLYKMAEKARLSILIPKVKPAPITKILIKGCFGTSDREVKVGDIIHTSWGYNMTHNDYAKIVEISSTGKTVVCVMISNTIIDGGGFAGKETANPNNEISEKFRLRVDNHGFRGSYFYCAPHSGKRFGYFSPWDGKPDYYNTLD